MKTTRQKRPDRVRRNKFEAKGDRNIKTGYSRMCLTQYLHPYECDISVCPFKEEHIWYDLQVVKNLLLNR